MLLLSYRSHSDIFPNVVVRQCLHISAIYGDISRE